MRWAHAAALFVLLGASGCATGDGIDYGRYRPYPLDLLHGELCGFAVGEVIDLREHQRDLRLVSMNGHVHSYQWEHRPGRLLAIDYYWPAAAPASDQNHRRAWLDLEPAEGGLDRVVGLSLALERGLGAFDWAHRADYDAGEVAELDETLHDADELRDDAQVEYVEGEFEKALAEARRKNPNREMSWGGGGSGGSSGGSESLYDSSGVRWTSVAGREATEQRLRLRREYDAFVRELYGH